MIKLFNGNCYDILPQIIKTLHNPVIVSDPPFNIGYHYNKYKDKMPDSEYMEKMTQIFSMSPSVVVHYPETLYRLCLSLGKTPIKVVSWVYPSNTGKQHRDIAFFDVKPDFRKVRQPYKNPNDKRIKARIEAGCKGGRLYDWWEINQVKNVSKEKTEHPCQMPLEVMDRIVGILPDDVTIIDPFMGSGTTGCSAIKNNRSFVGIEVDSKYYDIANKRIFEVLNEQT
jgi:DNA modification methylase